MNESHLMRELTTCRQLTTSAMSLDVAKLVSWSSRFSQFAGKSCLPIVEIASPSYSIDCRLIDADARTCACTPPLDVNMSATRRCLIKTRSSAVMSDSWPSTAYSNPQLP